MAFQFHCPRGHLLLGEEALVGQQCACPLCGAVFFVPRPVVAAYPVMPAVAPPIPPPAVTMLTSAALPVAGVPLAAAPPVPPPPPELPPAERAAMDPFAALKAAVDAPAPVETAPIEVPAAENPAEAPQEPALLHIPCPKGHVLETPEEMLDQEVLCPHCNTQFVLRRKNSLEFKRKQEERERLREIKVGNFWLNWAIVAVVLVTIGLLALIVVRSLSQTPVGQ